MRARHWNTLRVKITAVLVAAILLVVTFASAVSFFLLDPSRMRVLDDSLAEQIIFDISLAEGQVRPGVFGGLLERPPVGMVDPMRTRGLNDAMARRGVDVAVTALEPGPDHPPRVYARLADGRYLQLPLMGPPRPGNGFLMVLAWLALVALGTTGVVVLAITRLTRPLALIEAAIADAASTGELPHLAEEGTTEVRTTARTINRLSEQLKTAMESRMRIVAAAAHDFRTPLTRLRLRAEFLPEDAERDKWLADLMDLDRIADSAIRLVREEVQPASEEVLRLDTLVVEIVEELTQMALPAELVRAEPVSVRGRPMALKRAVRNLAINAATHGRRARVSIFPAGGYAVLEIADEGPGIPEALLPRVFEPFFRVDPARQTSIPGAGLGLAIAKEIIERQQGTLALSNQPDGGLMQRVRIAAAD